MTSLKRLALPAVVALAVLGGCTATAYPARPAYYGTYGYAYGGGPGYYYGYGGPYGGYRYNRGYYYQPAPAYVRPAAPAYIAPRPAPAVPAYRGGGAVYVR